MRFVKNFFSQIQIIKVVLSPVSSSLSKFVVPIISVRVFDCLSVGTLEQSNIPTIKHSNKF